MSRITIHDAADANRRWVVCDDADGDQHRLLEIGIDLDAMVEEVPFPQAVSPTLFDRGNAVTQAAVEVACQFATPDALLEYLLDLATQCPAMGNVEIATDNVARWIIGAKIRPIRKTKQVGCFLQLNYTIRGGRVQANAPTA